MFDRKYRKKDFIVKVQVSMTSSTGVQMVLVYNENKEIWFEGPISNEIKSLMRGRLKAYFNCRLVNTLLDIKDEVEPQNW